MLMQKTGIDKKQLKNWFTNARRRIWKPMLKKQLEAGKLVAHGAPPGTTGQGGANGGMVMVDNGMYVNQMQSPAQPAAQQPPQNQQYGAEMSSSNEMYANFQQAQMLNYDQEGNQQVSCNI
jgi:hypothetical protein